MNTYLPWQSHAVSIADETGERITLETGSYGYGSWYWGALEALRDMYALLFPLTHESSEDWRAVNDWVTVCENLLSGDEIQLSDDTEDYRENLTDYAMWSADILEGRLNDSLPDGFTFHFAHGELFLSPICDDGECDREDCAHNDW